MRKASTKAQKVLGPQEQAFLAAAKESRVFFPEETEQLSRLMAGHMLAVSDLKLQEEIYSERMRVIGDYATVLQRHPKAWAWLQEQQLNERIRLDEEHKKHSQDKDKAAASDAATAGGVTDATATMTDGAAAASTAATSFNKLPPLRPLGGGVGR